MAIATQVGVVSISEAKRARTSAVISVCGVNWNIKLEVSFLPSISVHKKNYLSFTDSPRSHRLSLDFCDDELISSELESGSFRFFHL